MIYHLSHKYKAWLFQDFNLFKDSRIHAPLGIDKELSRNEKNIKLHYENSADYLKFPPFWKILEQSSLGTLSKLYNNLKKII